MTTGTAAHARALWVLSTCWVLIGGPSTVAAEPPAWSILLPVDAVRPANSAQAAWLARIETQHADTHEPAVSVAHLSSALSLDTDTLSRTDVERLASVEQRLLDARRHSAQLAESDALAALNEGQQLIQGLLHLPGAPAFYAEVETAIGLVAAQAGMDALAIAALRRAAVVDPMRRVRDAETTPAWVEKAAAIAREIAAGPQGELTVSVNVAGARVFVDDAPQGVAPLNLRTTRGVHVLRVEAPGFRSFGMLLPVDAGGRPPLHVQLNRDPIAVAVDALQHAAVVEDEASTRRALQQLRQEGAPIAAAWWIATSTEHPERALVTRCALDGCEATRRLELDSLDPDATRFGQALDPAGLGRDRHRRDLAWLHAPDPSATPLHVAEAPSPWWQRWYVWTGAAVLLGGATALGVAASHGPETSRLRVTVEP